MTDSGIEFASINGEKIVLKGIGKMFYQNGFPISIAITELRNKGFKVSILHVADECLKNGWSPETTIKKLHEDFADSGGESFDKEELSVFCFSSYEEQRGIIFNSLFSNNENSIQHLRNIFKPE